MNKFYISIAAILLAFQASAQTEKGSQTFGFNFGYTSNSADNLSIAPGSSATTTLNTKTTSFTIGPNYSYFIADKIDVGINFSYNHGSSTNVSEKYSTTNDNYAASQPTHSLGVDIFIRKAYLYKNIGFRVAAYTGLGSVASTTDYSPSLALYDSHSTGNYHYVGANLDVVYYPLKELGVSASLANLEFEHFTSDKGSLGHGSGNYFNTSFTNNGLTVVVFYILGKKKTK